MVGREKALDAEFCLLLQSFFSLFLSFFLSLSLLHVAPKNRYC